MRDAPYPLQIKASPDADGPWFHDTMRNNPELARSLRNDYRTSFTPAFVEFMADSVQRCREELVLVDIGGKPFADNQMICQHATHVVILAGDPARFPEWRRFAEDIERPVVAEVRSALHDLVDKVGKIAANGVLRGSIHRLERGEPVANRPMVRALAKHLLTIGSVSVQKPRRGPVSRRHVEIAEGTMLYRLELEQGVLRVGFGHPVAHNDKIVRYVSAQLDDMVASRKIAGGDLIRINGPASLPVCMAIAHKLAHLYEAVAWYDPKMAKYVVAITHSPDYAVGDLVD